MSEAVTRPGITADALLASLDPLLRAWLPRQRWFAGKGRPITELTVVSATELLPPTSESGLSAPARTGPAAAGAGAGGQPACRIPATATNSSSACARELPPRLAPALIGHVDARARSPGSRSTKRCTTPACPGCCSRRCGCRARVGALRFERDPRMEIAAGPRPARAGRRAVQLLAGLRGHVHPEALPPHRARRQPRPGAAAGAGPRGLRAGARARRLVPGSRTTDAADDVNVLGRAPALPARARRTAGSWPCGARRRAGLHRRGAGARPRHRRGARALGPRPADRHAGPRPGWS